MSAAAAGFPAGAENLNLRQQPLFQEENENHRLIVYLSTDKMKAYLLIERLQPELKVTREMLFEKLEAGGLVYGVDDMKAEECRTRAVSRSGAQFMEIASGHTPEHGADGQVEFYVQPSSAEARYQKDATGRVNYHELNLIENVSVGQELARILPPKPGTPGRIVTGEEIAPRIGQPARIRPGKGTRMAPDGETFIAEIAGRLVHADETLSIDQQWEIKGDVDYSVGNIDFVGKVIVHGEVLDDFNVRGQMGVEVRGAVGKCKLTSEADIVLSSGINGKTVGQLRAGGSVRARYLNEAIVEAGGDVKVERECYNSIIHTAGGMQSSGKIAGGEVVALKGIETNTAGSDLGVATKLVAGVDYRRSERLRVLNEKIAELDKEIDRVSGAIGPLLSNPKKVAALPADKKKVVLALVGHLRAVKEKREGCLAQIQQVTAGEAAAVKQINIKDKLYPGVTVEVGFGRLLLKGTSTGPLSLVEDLAGDTVRIVPYSPLGAAKIEEPPSSDAAGAVSPDAPTVAATGPQVFADESGKLPAPGAPAGEKKASSTKLSVPPSAPTVEKKGSSTKLPTQPPAAPAKKSSARLPAQKPPDGKGGG